jgi:hypothetical protein
MGVPADASFTRRTVGLSAEAIARLLLVVVYLLPSAAFSVMSLTGTLPGGLDEDVTPACLPALWMLPSLPLLLRRPTFRNRSVLRAVEVLVVLAAVSFALAHVFGVGGPVDAWMPPLAGACALLPFACVDRDTGRSWLTDILVTNAMTLPGVLAKRLVEGSDFLRLNVSNLNVNSSGLVYGLAFCAAVTCVRAQPHARARSLWLAAGLYATVVLLSGSRTAALFLVAPWCTREAVRRLRMRQVVLVAGLVATLLAVMGGRIGEGEEYGSTRPPDELQGGAAESLSVVGRAWSLMVGWEVLQEAAPIGTQSVEGTVSEFQAKGFYSFAHSTFLMFVIVYGVVGAFLCVLCTSAIARIDSVASIRVATLAVMVASGGLVTNPKELALTVAVLLVLFQQTRSGVCTPDGRAVHGPTW